MAMRKYHDFKSAKEIYIEQVLRHIHYKKMHKRITEEISSHMDDMYEDFKDEFDSEIETTKKVINEMGNPDDLGLELKEANKRKLFIAKILKIAFAISILPALVLTHILVINLVEEVRPYFYAEEIEIIEQQIADEHNNGEPVIFLAEAENNGIVHRYYLPTEQKEGRFEFYYTESIIVFGKSFKDKFLGFGSTSGPYSDVHLFNLDEGYPANDHLIVLTGNPEEKYVKLYLEPIDRESELEPYWSDFIEIPQGATYENPIIFKSDVPEEYKWNTWEAFDKNKEPIVYSDDENENNTWSSTVTS